MGFALELAAELQVSPLCFASVEMTTMVGGRWPKGERTQIPSRNDDKKSKGKAKANARDAKYAKVRKERQRRGGRELHLAGEGACGGEEIQLRLGGRQCVGRCDWKLWGGVAECGAGEVVGGGDVGGGVLELDVELAEVV